MREDKQKRDARAGVLPTLEMSAEEVDEALAAADAMEVDDLESTSKELLGKGASDDKDDGQAKKDQADKDDNKAKDQADPYVYVPSHNTR